MNKEQKKFNELVKSVELAFKLEIEVLFSDLGVDSTPERIKIITKFMKEYLNEGK
jgi:hypothetical protein